MRLTDGTPTARRALTVDLLALALFIVVGMRSHDIGSQAEVFLRNALPIGGAWFTLAFVVAGRLVTIAAMRRRAAGDARP